MKKKKQLLHPDTMLLAGLVMFIIMISSFVLAYSGVVVSQFSWQDRNMICAPEERTCPNGSIIMRTGPACEFSRCPSDAVPNRPGIIDEPFPISTLPEDQNLKTKKSAVLCTQEVKMCSDGSFVGKTGPKCEFAPCPSDLEIDSDR